MTCAKSGNADAVRMLIAHDAAINAKEPAQNQTALMWAAAEQHPDVVKALIEAEADLQAHTKKGFTALHFAAREGDQESARLLLAAGVNVNIRTQPESSRRRRWHGRVAEGTHGIGRRRRARSGLSGDVVRGQHPVAGRHGAGPGSAGAVPARSGSGPQRRRCRLHAAALGVDAPGRAAPPIRYTASRIRWPGFPTGRPSCNS